MGHRVNVFSYELDEKVPIACVGSVIIGKKWKDKDLLADLKANIEKYIESKRKVAVEYEAYFKNVLDIEFFVDSQDTFSNYWLNAVILKDKDAQLDFLQQTNDNGVMTRPIWELMNRLPMFENCENDGLKNTIWFADCVVNIPSSVRPSDLSQE